MRAQITKAEQEAYSLLEELSIDSIPTPLEEIASRLGIDIDYELSPNVSGVLMISNGKATIGIRSDEGDVRKRFTIAHEIGHFRMHKNVAELFVDKDNDYIIMKRSGSKDRFEQEANAFAAALLMPENKIENKLALFSTTTSTEDKIQNLATAFEVSTIAMTYRLSNLGLI